MSQLKTMKAVSGNVHRKSSMRKNSICRRSIKLSICAQKTKPEHLLRKLGADCTFLFPYIGKENPIRCLHAKYSDKNKRLRVIWRAEPRQREELTSEKVKNIVCSRDKLLEDSLQYIDEDFIRLPVNVKFDGEIGIDYGGVTR